MSERHAACIDAALGERGAEPLEAGAAELLGTYERTAARAHMALALDAPLRPPRDLRARLVAQGLHLLTPRRAKDD